MSTLEIDPPPHTLRLVSSHGDVQARDSRYRHAASLSRRGRELHRQVLQHALQSGHAIQADALRVVLAAKQTHDPGDLHRLTAAGIWQLLFVDVVAWCRARHLATPTGVATAVESLIDYLELTASLAPTSDSATALRAAVDECTGGWDTALQTNQVTGRRKRSLRSEGGKKHP